MLPNHPVFLQVAQPHPAIVTYAGDAPPATPAQGSGITRSLPTPSSGIELLVDLSDRRLYVQQDGKTQASYPIAIGMADWPTPQGRFQVQGKQVNPAWKHPITGEVVPPGADNPLGTRWIEFWADENWALGFHGTNQAELIGQAVSHGCIRLRNADIQAIYTQVEVGTVVVITA